MRHQGVHATGICGAGIRCQPTCGNTRVRGRESHRCNASKEQARSVPIPPPALQTRHPETPRESPNTRHPRRDPGTNSPTATQTQRRPAARVAAPAAACDQATARHCCRPQSQHRVRADTDRSSKGESSCWRHCGHACPVAAGSAAGYRRARGFPRSRSLPRPGRPTQRGRPANTASSRPCPSCKPRGVVAGTRPHPISPSQRCAGTRNVEPPDTPHQWHYTRSAGPGTDGFSPRPAGPDSLYSGGDGVRFRTAAPRPRTAPGARTFPAP